MALLMRRETIPILISLPTLANLEARIQCCSMRSFKKFDGSNKDYVLAENAGPLRASELP